MALLGMSSWHLYPDMVVLGGVTVEVKQNDKLFFPSTVLTIGLQFVDKSRRSVSWSLSLAHLKYYGHPVQSSCSFGPENSRVTIDQFAYIILGCVLGGWKEYGSTAALAYLGYLRYQNFLTSFQSAWKTHRQWRTGPQCQQLTTQRSKPFTIF